jgi:hypothetical protein
VRRAALAAAAVLLLVAGGAAAAKKKPAPLVHEAGFEVVLPDGWRRVEQDTGGGEHEPLLKLTSDKTNQWGVVVRMKGPTDDAWEKPAEALGRFEAGFSTAAGYQKISAKALKLPRRKGAKGTIPAADLWFKMQRDGKPVTVGARALFFKGYTLALVVDSPGKKPNAQAKAVLASFVPSLVDE